MAKNGTFRAVLILFPDERPRTMSKLESGDARRIVLIGAPVDAGAGHAGGVMGPAALRVAGLMQTLAELGHQVRDAGDVVPDALDLAEAERHKSLKNLSPIAGWSRALNRAGFAALENGEMPVFMGGDHSLSMGSVTATARFAQEQKRPFFLLWLDAHTDFNTPETSPSGNMHGMPLALLCGEPGLEAVFGPEPRALVKPAHVHMLGIRSVDRQERALVEARGIDVVDMRQIDEFGVIAPLRRILEHVSAQNGLLHVSFDVDFLDPGIAPGVGTAVPGGATYREAHLIMEMLHDSGLVSAVDLVELNPFPDERGRSARVMVELAASLFGQRIITRRGGDAAP
jgi:arginase